MILIPLKIYLKIMTFLSNRLLTLKIIKWVLELIVLKISIINSNNNNNNKIMIILVLTNNKTMPIFWILNSLQNIPQHFMVSSMPNKINSIKE